MNISLKKMLTVILIFLFNNISIQTYCAQTANQKMNIMLNSQETQITLPGNNIWTIKTKYVDGNMYFLLLSKGSKMQYALYSKKDNTVKVLVPKVKEESIGYSEFIDNRYVFYFDDLDNQKYIDLQTGIEKNLNKLYLEKFFLNVKKGYQILYNMNPNKLFANSYYLLRLSDGVLHKLANSHLIQPVVVYENYFIYHVRDEVLNKSFIYRINLDKFNSISDYLITSSPKMFEKYSVINKNDLISGWPFQIINIDQRKILLSNTNCCNWIYDDKSKKVYYDLIQNRKIYIYVYDFSTGKTKMLCSTKDNNPDETVLPYSTIDSAYIKIKNNVLYIKTSASLGSFGDNSYYYEANIDGTQFKATKKEEIWPQGVV